MTTTSAVRWTVRVVGVGLVAALAVLLALRIYGSRRLAAAERRCAAVLGRWDASEYASPRVSDAENAAIVLRAGAEAILLPDAERGEFGALTWRPARSWSEPQRVFLRRVLADNRPALELLRRAAGMEESSFGLRDLASVSDEIRDWLPFFKLLQAQRLLYLDAGLALLDADRATLVADVRAMSAMAAALEREAPLISELVGVAAEKMFLEVVAQAVAEPGLDADTLTAIQGSLVDVDLRAAWKRSLALGRLAARLTGAAQRHDATGVRALLFTILADYDEAPYAEALCGFAKALDTPFGSRPTAPRSTADVRVPPVGAPSVGHLTTAAVRNEVVLSQRRLARIALALRVQTLRTGSYPNCLARFDEAAKRDPFTGGKLVYLRRGDGSAQLSVPDGVTLWDRANPEVHNPGPFTWELPAPARQR